MRKRRQEFPVMERAEIIDAGSEGKAVARVNDMVIFVPFVVPGDVVDIQIRKKKRSYAEGKAIHFHKYSEYRTEPRCRHFGICGGCRWQNMEYRYQLYFKEKQVRDNFERIGKLTFPEIRSIIPSGEIFHYRNKLEFTFSSRRWLMKLNPDTNEEINMNGLGFHLPGMFDRVLDLEECLLQPDPSDEIRLAVRQFAIENGYTFHNPKNWQGLLRNLYIRNTTTGEWMVIMVFGAEEEEKINRMMNFIKERFPFLFSLMYTINPKQNDDISLLEIRLFSGKAFITEDISPFREGDPILKYRIGPASFSQTNPKQAVMLYRTATELAGFKGNETVYDLYTGTGTIANYIARSVKKVTGIEFNPAAIEDAKENSKFNAIANTTFFSGDLAKMLTPEFIKENGYPDIIITDPPRAGMHEKVVEQILFASPEKVVYISCNPATQARDIALMADYYQISAVQPVDMFPHTQHVENIVLLRKKK